MKRVRRVEYDPGWRWIARDKFGLEYMETGFRWSSRSVARDVVEQDKALGDKGVEARRRELQERRIRSFLATLPL